MLTRIQDHVKTSVVHKLQGDEGPILDLAWSSDGLRLVSASRGGVLRLWDRGRNQVRFIEKLGGDAITSVRWSTDETILACSTDRGAVISCDPKTLIPKRLIRQPDGYGITCLAWAPIGSNLAFAGIDNNVYFVDCGNGSGNLGVRKGTGHMSAVQSIAWSIDGKTLVSGTKDGSIGVWIDRSVDWQLRHFLPGSPENPLYPHKSKIQSMAWSKVVDVLASASSDGTIRFWDVDNRRELAATTLSEPLFSSGFCYDGRLFVAQTLERLHFFRVDRFQEIGAIDAPTHPASGCLSINEISSSIATVDDVEKVVKIHKVDFVGLLKNANISNRSYRNAKVIILGASGEGKSNLAMALGGQPYNVDHSGHGLQVHPLTLPDLERDDGTVEKREIAIWDLPTQTHFGLAEHFPATIDKGATTALFALDARSTAAAKHLLDQLNRHSSRDSKGLDSGQSLSRIIVATKCDRVPGCTEKHIRETLDISESESSIFLTSAKEGLGIRELREKIISQIDWSVAPLIKYFDIFADIREFIRQKLDRGMYLASLSSLYTLFITLYSQYEKSITEQEFRATLQLLENLGSVYHLQFGDQILLQPGFFYAYAAALMSAAKRDKEEMGRLPMDEAEDGYGEQFELQDNLRIPDSKQETLLLKATIEELLEMELISEVSTDGTSYLVFPTQPIRSIAEKLSSLTHAATCTIVGDGENVYSSLIVRLLGLPTFYPRYELGKDGAIFSTVDGVSCGVVRSHSTKPGTGELKLVLDAAAGDHVRQTFLKYVRSHIESKIDEQSRQWSLNESTFAGSRNEPSKANIVPVFICYDRENLDNVRKIAEAIKQHHIVNWMDDLSMIPGDPPSKRNASRELHQIAVVAVSKSRLSKAMTEDCKFFRNRGSRIVPVILPSAPRDFSIPEILSGYRYVDFRELGQEPYEKLVQGIRAANENAQGQAEEMRTGHVFMSYCRDNEVRVESLRDDIVAAGHKVWWDRDIPAGKDWRAEIRAGMSNAYAVVICFSKEVQERERSGVYPEILDAIENYRGFPPDSIYLVPARLSKCIIPSIRIDSVRTLDSIQTIDLFGAKRTTEFRRLIESLEGARRKHNKHG